MVKVYVNQKTPELLVEKWLADEPENTAKKMKYPKIEYCSVIDPQKRLKYNYEVRGIPHCVIINPDGVIVWERWLQLEGFLLNAEVDQALIKG